jgi:hypothetical protein
LVERVLCKHEVIGSIPFTSTKPVDFGLGWLERIDGSEDKTRSVKD